MLPRAPRPGRFSAHACDAPDAKGEVFGPHVDTDGKALGDIKIKRFLDLVQRGAATDEARVLYSQSFEAPTSLGQLPDRFCSVFIYLNNVREGGRTTFSSLDDAHLINDMAELIDCLRPGGASGDAPAQAGPQSSSSSLSIVPQEGMAVVHFPTASTDFFCMSDSATKHESEVAVSPKFIVQQCEGRT